MDRVSRVQGLRRSNAARAHGDRRTKRNRSRAARRSRAIKEYS